MPSLFLTYGPPLQVGGFRAQRSHITALAWAALPTPASPPSPPPQAPDQQHHPHQHLQAQEQLLLFSGSSDGCVRVHGQCVEALGKAEVPPGAGALLKGDLMQLRKTLHEVDLLEVTCLSVKPSEVVESGKLAMSLPSQLEFQMHIATLLLCLLVQHIMVACCGLGMMHA